MKAVITGGAGFIGSHVAELLKKKGFEVDIFDNLSTGSTSNIKGLNIIKGDISDRDALQKAFLGADFVIHNAALISVPESMQKPGIYHDINVKGALNVLNAAKGCGVKRVVFASSAAVYGEAKPPVSEDDAVSALSIYALNKIMGEKYCRFYNDQFGLQAVILRYFNVFGPRQLPDSPYAAAIPKFISSKVSGKRAKIFGDGSQTRDFVFVKDVAMANYLALTKKEAAGNTFNIASGRSISIVDLAKKLDLDFDFAPPRPGDILHSLADVSFSRSVLGDYSTVDLDSALKETVEWYSSA